METFICYCYGGWGRRSKKQSPYSLTHPKTSHFTHWELDAESFNSIFPSHNINIPKFRQLSHLDPFGNIWHILLVNMWLWCPCLLAILLASAFLLPLTVVGTARTGKTATWRQHPAAPRWLWSPLNPKAKPKMGIDKGGVMENKRHLYLQKSCLAAFFLVEGHLKQWLFATVLLWKSVLKAYLPFICLF